jgi:hypothetical protein
MHTIRFFVDGEDEVTNEHDLTPNFIIKEFGHKDPATHYLVRLQGNHLESYQDKADDPIRMHNNLRFQIISLGPTPVSDAVKVGFSAFLEGLHQLGFEAEVLDPAKRRIVFDYQVESGKYAGQVFRIGLEVPVDFPLTPPSGPHVLGRLHPVGQSGAHPTANVSQSDFGPDWQYWSRPFVDWNPSKKTVALYMAHIWRLWHTQ